LSVLHALVARRTARTAGDALRPPAVLYQYTSTARDRRAHGG